MTTTPRPLCLLPTALDGPDRADCQCGHDDRPGGRCGAAAQVRVTVVCVGEGCDCAAGVHLICRECLGVWRRHARRDGVRLRVRPL